MDPDALARIGDALAAQPDRQRALELLLTEPRRLTRAEAGTVYLREGDRLRFAAVQNDVLARRFGTDEARRRLAAEPLARGVSRRGVVAAAPARLLRREAVAHTRLGQEIPGAGGLGLELVAQVRQVDAHVVGLVGMRRPPDVTEQLRVRDDLARVPDERRQELVRDRWQAHLPVTDEHLPPPERHPRRPRLDRRVVALVRRARGMAERDADPREELVRAEGLAHVVVGADIEGGHLVALL